MTTRMNISVPADVRERMAGVAGVNWSAVAVEAFRRVLDGAPPPAGENRRLRRLTARLTRVCREWQAAAGK